MKQDWCSVELTATMVRQQNAIDTEFDTSPGVFERLDALDDYVAPLLVLDPDQVVAVDGGFEHRVQEIGDGAVELSERAEPDRLSREEVETPLDSRDCIEHGSAGERRRDSESVVPITQPRTGDRDVDVDKQGVEAVLSSPVHDVRPAVAVFPHLQTASTNASCARPAGQQNMVVKPAS